MSDTFSYHANPPGKLGVWSKPINNRADLALAYTPGVAKICLEIARDSSQAALFTNIYNRVAVISDGTATLGLGNIGPLACKPVMEGKAALMSQLAHIDAIDLVCNPGDISSLIRIISRNFGAINIEDVAAPQCFEIVDSLSQELNIPIFHDDQHGTAVVVVAALHKALKITNKDIGKIKLVVAGAGAGAQASVLLLLIFGLNPNNIYMFDSQGLLTTNRTLDKYKQRFARASPQMTYAEALKGADVFIGLSAANIIEPKWIAEMSQNPIIFALANPVPEIDIIEAQKIRPDGIFATGKSDDPNQVNNALCFPFLFRGVLDARSRAINTQMLKACVNSLSAIPGPNLLPDPFDWRLMFTIAPAVVETAMQTNVSDSPIHNLNQYKWNILSRHLGVKNIITDQAFPEHPAQIESIPVSHYISYNRATGPQFVTTRPAHGEWVAVGEGNKIVDGSDIARLLYHDIDRYI